MASTVVVQQPVVRTQKIWTSGICDCCLDMSSCCFGFWCLPCAACQTSAQFGEGTCLPLVDFLGSAWLSLCGIPMCVPPVALALRVAVRHKYDIQGSICDDIVVTLCCVSCSWCQMAREIKAQKVGTAVESVVYSIQPQPVTMAPQHVTMAPQHVTMAPQHVTMPPQHVTMAPQHVTMPPQHVTTAPQHVTMAPQHVTMAPQHVTTAPQHVMPDSDSDSEYFIDPE